MRAARHREACGVNGGTKSALLRAPVRLAIYRVGAGHPLGASGGRTLGTLARSLHASGQRWGVAAI